MKILYGIQGTGHGHISRARELLPELSRYAKVDILVSGYASQLNINQPVKYRKYGISLNYDARGGVSVLDTLRNLRPKQFISDVQSISIGDYDLVVSDYEPVTAWAARQSKIPSIGLSHQAAFLSSKTPRPDQKSFMAESILQHFSPCDVPMGFHFKRYDKFIEPPIIRSGIRELQTRPGSHITVYLPAFDTQVLQKLFAPFSNVDWHIFSPNCKRPRWEGNCRIHPIAHQPFLQSLAGCRGVMCSAGFETCAEAMYLGKKLLAVPIRNQYEQACNAAALEKSGVTVLQNLEQQLDEIENWLVKDKRPVIEEIAEPEDIVQRLLEIGAKECQVTNYSADKTSLFRTA